MDRSIRTLADPGAPLSSGERRHSIRQKLHTPVYASFNASQSSLVVDLSELLDLHEDGFAVQTSERLEVNRAVTVCLDLPETKSLIHGNGRVVWSDDAGRGGIQLSGLPESARQILKEWLFANLLIACANHAARTEQLAERYGGQPDQPVPVEAAGVAERPASPPVQSHGGTRGVMESAPAVPISDDTPTFSAVEAVRIEVREIGDDVDAVLQLLPQRALTLTRASGSALAFLTGDQMIWRAKAGVPAPPLGALVDVRHGLSGECVRSGLLVSCEDMTNDPRVDPALSRSLGIGSLVAAPIVSGFRVVGLLEIFSPKPRAFTRAHEAIVRLLVDMVPATHPETKSPETTKSENFHPEPLIGSEELPVAAQAPALELGPTELGLSDSGGREADSIDLISINVTGDALWDQEPEVFAEDDESAAQLPDEPIVAEQSAGEIEQPASDAPPGKLPLGLLGAAVLVVMIAVGYLVGPLMEKRWTPSPQASQNGSAGDPAGEGAPPRTAIPRTAINDAPPNRSSAIAGAAQPVSASQGFSGQRPDNQRLPVRSLTELQALADRGDAEAQWQMGVRYHNGDGIAQNDRLAMLWFQLAAEQGHVPAQSALGSYYWAGRGVPEDLSKAYMWSAIALAGGDEISKSRLEGLASRMTRAEISVARQQADAWIHNHTQSPRTN